MTTMSQYFTTRTHENQSEHMTWIKTVCALDGTSARHRKTKNLNKQNKENQLHDYNNIERRVNGSEVKKEVKPYK